MRKELVTRFALLAISVVGLITLPMPHVVAQGCAMCYQSASATGAQGGAALRHGILILLFPTLSIFFGVFALIYHRRNTSR